MFFKGSRYEGVENDSITDAQGRTIVFKKVRFVPDRPAPMGYMVGQGERLDHIAQKTYHNPELFWLICDANRAMWPDDLMAETGRVLVIPPAEG